MPIDVRIDRPRRLVNVTFEGALTPDEMCAYHADTWASGQLEGYVELLDLRGVDSRLLPFGKLLELAAEAPGHRPVRLALVVSSEDQLEKAHFFRSARDILGPHAGEIGSFSSLEEAQKWLADPATADPVDL